MTAFVSLTRAQEAADRAYDASLPTGWTLDTSFGLGGSGQSSGAAGGYVYALKPSGMKMMSGIISRYLWLAGGSVRSAWGTHVERRRPHLIDRSNGRMRPFEQDGHYVALERYARLRMPSMSVPFRFWGVEYEKQFGSFLGKANVDYRLRSIPIGSYSQELQVAREGLIAAFGKFAGAPSSDGEVLVGTDRAWQGDIISGGDRNDWLFGGAGSDLFECDKASMSAS